MVLIFWLIRAAAADEPPAAYGQIGTDWACSACTGALSEVLAGVTASSSLGTAYGPKNALDGDPNTAWCEGADGPGEGAWIELSLRSVVHLDAVTVAGGYFKSAAVLAANARVAAVTFTVDGGRSHQRRLADPVLRGTNGVDAAPIADPAVWFTLTRRAVPILGMPDAWRDAAGIKPAKTLRLTLDRVYPGAAYADACISEIGLIFADPKELE